MSETAGDKPLKTTDKIVQPLINWLPEWLTPNHLSILRACMAIPIFLLIFLGFFPYAGCLLIFADLLDWFDGAMARIRGSMTKLGALLDPTADKIVNAVVFLGFLFWIKSNIYLGLIISIIMIDSLLFGVAIFKFVIKDIFPFLDHKQDIFDRQLITSVTVSKTGANAYGKIKMVLQSITLACLLIFNPARSIALHNIIPQLPDKLTLLEISYFLLIGCVVFGVLSLYGHLKVIEFKKA